MQSTLVLCHEPPLYVGSQRVLVAVECRGFCLAPAGGHAGLLHVTARPVALVLLDDGKGRVALATGFPWTELEELLLAGAEEGMHVG